MAAEVRTLGYCIISSGDLDAWEVFARDLLGLQVHRRADRDLAVGRGPERPLRGGSRVLQEQRRCEDQHRSNLRGCAGWPQAERPGAVAPGRSTPFPARRLEVVVRQWRERMADRICKTSLKDRRLVGYRRSRRRNTGKRADEQKLLAKSHLRLAGASVSAARPLFLQM